MAPEHVDRSVSIGGNAEQSVIQTGDHNTATLDTMTLPDSESVDITAEVAAIRALLDGLRTSEHGKIGRALDDIDEELEKAEPDRNEVGSALARALGYARLAANFADTVVRLRGHVSNTAAWLGENWYGILETVGLTPKG